MPHVTDTSEYTKQHPVHGYTFKQWKWVCACRQTSEGYPSKFAAERGAQLHRETRPLFA